MNAHERLRADLMSAIAEHAPARARRRSRTAPRLGAPLLAAIAIVAAAGVALAATGVFSAGERVRVPAGRFGHAQAMVIDGGTVGRLHWRFAVRPCHSGSVAIATLIGRGDLPSGGGFGSCGSSSRSTHPLVLSWTWTPGITVVVAITQPEVKTVTVELRRRNRTPSGRVIHASAGTATLRTRAIPPAALNGRASGLRFLTLVRPYSVSYTKAIARDGAGKVLVVCTPQRC